MTDQLFSLAGKKALVTGASRGIGQVIAVALDVLVNNAGGSSFVTPFLASDSTAARPPPPESPGKRVCPRPTRVGGTRV